MALRKYSSRTVGGNLKKIRQALNMSQEEFGKLAGDYSQDTVARWEAGQVPHALTLGLISKATNVTVDSILGHSKLITAKIVLKGKTKKNLQRVGKKETLSKKGGGGGGEGGGTVVEMKLFPPLSENGRNDMRIPTQIDTHSAGKSTLVPIEIGTCSDANRHTRFRVS
jgi:transcriptional regulator with XRE-family HTH domain